VNSRTPNSPALDRNPTPSSRRRATRHGGDDGVREDHTDVKPAMGRRSLLVRRVDCAAEAHGVALAKAMAASRSSNDFDDSTGPKSSSLPARESTGTSVNTVAGNSSPAGPKGRRPFSSDRTFGDRVGDLGGQLVELTTTHDRTEDRRGSIGSPVGRRHCLDELLMIIGAVANDDKALGRKCRIDRCSGCRAVTPRARSRPCRRNSRR